MPLVMCRFNIEQDAASARALLQEISKSCCEVTGKPESYMMVSRDTGDLLFAGNDKPAAYLDIRGIAVLNKPMNQKLSATLCGLIHERLGIDPQRIYITFTDVAASDWGWNGTTFG